MAFITISGFPSAGKSTFVQKLTDDFRARLADPEYAGPSFDIAVVQDDLGHEGRQIYAGSSLFLFLSFSSCLSVH